MVPLLLHFLPFLLSASGAAVADTTGVSSSAGISHPFSLQEPSAYAVLQSFNFPIGLLPQGNLGYDLDPGTGSFSAYFNGTCSFSLEGSYQLRYQSTISGRISTNRLSDLRGVSVKLLMFWINIVEVVRRGDELEFSVGIASADFPIDNFYISPQCGCGVDCVSAGDRRKDGGVKLRSSF
ncbi:hypothetical protein AXF42_Ash016738 [Apostasia shenzhenica]|uniref:Uncharacterized protein n=1 Tax=Apostasia shenzhenica TaxID=1088818 RepID=A0A2I0AQ67_9ASPA|nr:hypothetical protein AXF42_Ash016738 [Apostasia shenzhenica]